MSLEPSPNYKPTKKKKKAKEWKINKMFQNLGKKATMCKFVVDLNGKVNMTMCCVCLKIERRNKLLIPKFNNL